MSGAARPPSDMETEAEETAQVAERQLLQHPPLLAEIGRTLRELEPQLAAGSHVEGATNLPTVPGLHPAIAPAACMMSVYKMIAALSVARGLDPDAPPYLRKVTETR